MTATRRSLTDIGLYFRPPCVLSAASLPRPFSPCSAVISCCRFVCPLVPFSSGTPASSRWAVKSDSLRTAPPANLQTLHFDSDLRPRQLRKLAGIRDFAATRTNFGESPGTAAGAENPATGMAISVETGVPEVKGSLAPNGLAIITLDRPKALNAMNLEMDLAFAKLLDGWAADPSVKAVLVEGSTPRAFCSGMDVKGVAATVRADPRTPLVKQVFATEYMLICAIARFRKPYLSFMDGVTMGFGLGLSGHGRFRIVTERSLLAMPENGIGLFPDVGFAHIAAKSPGDGAVGAYLALTGGRLNSPADALFAKLATHFVPSESLPKLREALAEADLSSASEDVIERAISSFSQVATEGRLERLLAPISCCFGPVSVRQTLILLQEEAESSDPEVSAWAKDSIQDIQKGAPFSLILTQRHLAACAAASAAGSGQLSQIEGVMTKEYRLAYRAALRPDFVEGVRAMLVDKDKQPKWQPPTLDEVSEEDVDEIFGPWGDASDELEV